MQANTQRNSSVSSLLLKLFFFTVLVVGLLLNAYCYLRLAELRNLHASLNSIFEKENSNADELTLLESQFKKYESEYQLMEHGLNRLYSTRCTGLDDFIPVFDDQLVACRTYKSQVSGYLIHVPKHKDIRLKIEAVKTKFQAAFRSSHDGEETLWSKSFPLEPESNYFVEVLRSSGGDKIQVKLSGRDCYQETEQLRRLRYGVENDMLDSASNVGVEDVEANKPVIGSNHIFERLSETIEFPFGVISSTGSLARSTKRIVLSPNQYSADPRSDRATCWFGSVMFQSARNEAGLAKKDVVLVRLSLESDGPFTSLPDDLMVVRKLLEDFKAGVEPQVVFHPDGWYEFEE